MGFFFTSFEIKSRFFFAFLSSNEEQFDLEIVHVYDKHVANLQKIIR